MANTDLEHGDVKVVDEIVQLLLVHEVKGHNHVPSIFRVPNVLKDISPDSYKPRVISIGALHREDLHGQAMEAWKGASLHNLLNKLKLPAKETLEACAEKVNSSISEIRQRYDEIITYGDGELTHMMVMDGFFILNFLYDYRNLNSDVMLFRSIIHDLILLENQIPFFVLHALFECTIFKCYPNISLISLCHDLLRVINIFDEQFFGTRRNAVLCGTYPNHLLGLLHESYHPEYPIERHFRGSKIQPAVKLDMAGVKFKPFQDLRWRIAIKVDESSKSGCFFWNWGKPTVRMPMMHIHDDTESIIRNLIVYEQISSLPNYITSYATAIDDLVDTEEDIAILVDSGVIINSLSSKQEAANIINNICKEIKCNHFIYATQWTQLERYCDGYWAKHMYPSIAQFKRTYFGSPWNFIALIAGIVLFALTIVQTIFTVNPA